MNKKFYITTTTPYVNDVPHIGHALEFVQADVIARYFRGKLGAENVHYNTGADEHGLKMFTKAKEAGLSPQEYVDKFAAKWQEFCELFNISYDSFWRTSSPEHHTSAQKFWRKSAAAGDIYKKHYEGLYCVGHEAFLTEKELVDGKCPDHGTVPVVFAEDNYFFKLSRYREHLLSWLDANPDVVKPASKLQELRNWIENMEDISISRLKQNLPWGVEVPDDPEQVFYVWFDALTNYINVIGFGTDDEKLAQWWPGVQIFGPDNLRFQGAIWQGMLESVGLPHTSSLLCHGMVLGPDGTKMSKTKGNTISPVEQQEKYGTEAVRFYLIGGISTYGDSPYIEEGLVNMYNSYLANNYGNLLSRVVHLANLNGISLNSEAAEFRNGLQNDGVRVYRENAEKAYSDYELQQAVELTNTIADFGNGYMTEQKPWESQDKAFIEKVLNNLAYVLETVTDLYEPIIPVSAAKARAALAKQEKIILFNKLEIV